MTITMTATAVALRPRTLSVQASPFGPFGPFASWREQVPSRVVPAGMRDTAAGDSLHPTHNSIPAALRSAVVLTTVATPATNGRGVYGAAKQAPPPRGVPR
jgi:hypothetical protein